MATKTLLGQPAREELIKGVDEVVDIVKVTLGSIGRNVALDRRWEAPEIINDGVKIAKNIQPENQFQAMGAELVKESAEKTVNACGDGTSTSLLLAQSIIHLGNEAIKSGSNPIILKRGIEMAVTEVVEELKKTATEIKDDKKLVQVATISANSKELGQTIAEAIKKVGMNGVVSVEEGVELKTKIIHKEGMQFDKGWQIPAFATNKDKMICEIENPYILFADFSISAQDEMADFLSNFIKTTQSKNIVFITDGVEGSALTALVINGQNNRGAIKTCAIFAPGIGIKRQEILQDMAIVTGGQVMLKENGVTLENMPFEVLGRCEKIEITADSTKIIGGKGDPEAIKKRIAALEYAINQESSDFQKEMLRERLAKLTGGVASIQIGAYSETEIKDLKERANDGVSSVKAAIAEGVVPGGGITYLKCRESLKPLLQRPYHKDEKRGIEIIYETLEKPLQQLLLNAGIEKGQELPIDGKTGFDLETGRLVNMEKAGVLDAVKVSRLALENAASVAKQILTCEGLVSEIIEDRKSPLEMPLQ